MRLRATVVAAAAVSSLIVPLAAPANAAVTTTATIVAYIADTDDDDAGELWTRPADGTGEPTKVFTTANDVWLPALSPDGTQVAYLEDEPVDFSYRLFVRPTNGSGSATLLSAGDILSPSWSADGTKVIFWRYDTETDEYGVYWVPATGGTPTFVPSTNSTALSDEPSFSPSGRQVAVTAWNSDWDTVLGIDLITLATGSRSRIVGTTGGSDPVWSPDGQYLLFQKEIACGWGLYRVPVGGGTAVPIRVSPGYFVGSAEYSQDGAQIFWSEVRQLSCNPGARDGEIYVANADGSDPQQVTADSATVEYGVSVAGGTRVLDTTAPAAPVINAQGVVSATSATISWTAAPDATEFVMVRKAAGAEAPTGIDDADRVYQGSARTASATGLMTNSVYDLYVFAIDASGNVSPPSAVHQAKALAAPVMGTIPRVGTTATNATFTVKWAGAAAAYQVVVGEKVKSSSGAWSTKPVFKTWVASTTAKSKTFTGGQGRSYYFQARGFDGLGNVTAYGTAKAAHVPLNENWSGLAYSTGWTSVAATSRYLGTYRHTTVAGKTITSRAVDTSSFTILGDKCPTCGQFKVYVDGVLKATVDTKGTTTATRVPLYVGPSLGAVKPHTVKIVTVGTTGRPRVAIDGIALTR